ncbi:MAG: lipid II flippase MurJ, partial [Candidatus Zixiibacteriota bacterium]
RIGYRFRLRINFLDTGLRKVVRLLGPMILGLSAGRINILLNTLLASFLMEGALSYLNYSYRLMHFPLGVFAVALGTVALPRVSEMVARREWDRLTRTYTETIGLNMFVVIPSAVFLALMGRQVVELIYQWGVFSTLDSEQTALALLHYAYGLVGFAAARVTVPFYYAFGDSRLPMRISIMAVLVNMALYWPMIRLLDFAGLAAATSIGGLLHFVVLLAYLPSKGIQVAWGHLGLNLLRMAVAALLAFYIAMLLPYGFMSVTPTLTARVLNVLLPTVVAGLLYLVFCVILRVREVGRLVSFITRRRAE